MRYPEDGSITTYNANPRTGDSDLDISESEDELCHFP
jgi:hypothetical protein